MLQSDSKSIIHGADVEAPDCRLDTLAMSGKRFGKSRIAAVDVGGKTWSFEDLEVLSGSFARRLVAAGVRRGDYVPVLIDHNGEALAVMLGIMRAGAAYVPLDRRWPADRLQKVFLRTRANHAVADAAGVSQILSSVGGNSNLEVIFSLGDSALWDDGRKDATVELWDTVGEQEGEAAGAGFVLGDRPSTEDVLVAQAYVRHVLAMCQPMVEEGTRILDIGAGIGLPGLELARVTGKYHAVDPSPSSLAVLLERAERLDLAEAQTSNLFAHEVADSSFRDADLILLASCVQFFPSPAYLWQLLERIAINGRHGLRVVIADVIDSMETTPVAGQLAFSRQFFGGLERLGFRVLVIERGEGFSGALSSRFDVILELEAVGQRRPLVEDLRVYQDERKLPSELTADDVAYCIFTSGSSGEPKGVVVSHRAAANILTWINREIDVNPDDKMLSVAPFAFDLSVYDLFGVPAAGASIVFVSETVLSDPDDLLAAVEEYSVTLWNSAPAAFGFLLSAVVSTGPSDRRAMRRVLLSGDYVPVTMPAKLRAAFPNARLTVLGGATEAAIWSCFYHVQEVDDNWTSIPYGQPVANTSFYVLDDAGEPLPIGSPGELHIGGVGVALGYLGDEQLTAERFTSDRWRPEPATKYATGDLVRIMPDGQSEILGRLDSQVKLNGYRVELTEVEAAIARHRSIDDVAAWVDSNHRLKVLYVTKRGASVTQSGLLRFASAYLPAYMLPSEAVEVVGLPQTNNGKLARDRLDAWAASRTVR